MTTLEAAPVVGMSEAEYHARPELSSTEARLILDSPAKFRWAKDHPPLIAPSKKFDVGSAVHAKVLGTGYEAVAIPDDLLASNGAISTTAAKEFVAQARAEGKIPLKSSEFQPILDQAEAVLAHPSARALFGQPGHAEVSAFADVDGVPCRARFDFLPDPSEHRRVAVDLKTTVSAAKRDAENSVARYGYFIQRGFYLDVLNAITGPMPEGMEPEMLFVFVEKDPPYRVAIYQIPTLWAAKGHEAAAEARQTYAECTRTGVWPSGLGDDVRVLDEPVWHTYAWEEEHSDV